MQSTQVLIVEDEIIIAKDIELTLRDLGYNVLAIVTSGEEAIRVASESRPDVVLMDIKLQGQMSGIEAAEHIYSQWYIPVIYLTAHADRATVQRAKFSGPYGYVIKPFDEHDLYTAIEVALYKYQVDSKLRKIERWFAATLRSIGDAVIATNLDASIVYMNPMAEVFTGWRQTDALDAKLTDICRFVDATTLLPIEDLVARVRREGLVVGQPDQTLLLGNTGRELAVDYTVAPIRDDQHQLVGAVLVFRDITERKRATLERLTFERQLQETQRLQSLGVLTGGIAHDFNNLLTAIRGNVELALLDAPTGSEIYAALEQANTATQRAANLTRQMLAYAGKGKYLVEYLALNKVVAEMTTLLKATIGKHIQLRHDLAPNLPMVAADASQLGQVVMNLVINASESIGEADGVITVATRLVDADRQQLGTYHFGDELPEGEYLVLEVADTGCGMSKATQAKIFEPFFTTKTTGRGLGLAAVFSIVDSHHGAIKLQSEVGRGATFTILLPSLGIVAAPQHPKQSNATGLRGRGTVLVIDDEEDIRGVATRMIVRWGFSVLTAADGPMGIAMFREQADAIVCVLLDVSMPNLDGYRVFQSLREIKPGVPIVLMSGHTEQLTLERFIGLQTSGFLHKPFAIKELRNKLQQIDRLLQN